VARRRLDAELARRGLVASRTEAREAVRAGVVLVAGSPATKVSTLVDDDVALVVAAPPRRFVSRGGDKLVAALERWGIDPTGLDCLDAGASTGGFTDCLLRAGAAKVAAVDVGYGQLAWTLRSDPRVTVLERTNVRDLSADALPFRPAMIVADLSFISLGAAFPALAGVAVDGAIAVFLVKPQFEAGRSSVGKGGVVRDPAVWASVLTSVTQEAAGAGFAPTGVMASPVRGPAGNVEFLLLCRAGGDTRPVDIEGAVEEGRTVAA
jgi:23S rRNA (cytidine1920-2'-O)/16S rRNA (cytidine1409-2'-O)-methyltransferase